MSSVKERLRGMEADEALPHGDPYYAELAADAIAEIQRLEEANRALSEACDDWAFICRQKEKAILRLRAENASARQVIEQTQDHWPRHHPFSAEHPKNLATHWLKENPEEKEG